jgi:hypothetical protein
MRKHLLAAALVVFTTAPAGADSGDLQLTIGNGRVTLVADNVPVRTILEEWARRGQSRIVNAEKVLGGPVTLRLIDVPEKQALDVVLRSVSGYLAAPRQTPVANASSFDRIMILASSRPNANAPMPTSQPAPRQFPVNINPGVEPVMEGDVMDDQVDNDPNDPRPVQMPSASDQPGPIQVPQPPGGDELQPQPVPGQPDLQGQPGAPGQPPQLPLTSPRPGLIVPPQQPQQPPVRRPGGEQ